MKTLFLSFTCLLILSSCSFESAEEQKRKADSLELDSNIKSLRANRKKYDCLLDNIKERDTLYLMRDVRGCFGGGHNVIKVFDRKGIICAQYTLINYSPPVEVAYELNDSSLLLIKQMEDTIKVYQSAVDRGMCTTEGVYTIKLKNDSLKLSDKSCRFNLYDEFLRRVFYSNINK